MKRLLISSLVVAAAVLPVCAQSEADLFQKGSYGSNYVELKMDKSRGQVLEYDGKNYKGASQSIEVGNKLGDMIFDFNLKDIGSKEENGTLDMRFSPSVKANARFDVMHHRMNYRRNGVDIDGVWVYNPNIIMYISTGTDLMYKRTEKEFNIASVSPENSANWFSAQYWSVQKKGQMDARYANFKVGAAEVNNLKQDVTLGLGTSLSDVSAVSVDLVNSRFEDKMTELPAVAGTVASTLIMKPRTGTISMIAGESKFRYTASNKLSITGALTTRKRLNETTNYTAKSGVGALNAVYRATQKLSMAVKLYSRWSQVGESASYVPPVNQNPEHSLAEMNKLMFRGDVNATYRPIEKLMVKGGYKVEFNNRKNAEDMNYAGTRYYFDGVAMTEMVSTWAQSDTKRTVSVGAKGELPFGIEAEASYKGLDANHPVFVNQGNASDDSNITVTIPLPYNISASLIGGYLTERNTESAMTNFHQARNIYMAGMDWSSGNKVFLGGDVAVERGSYYSNMWFGSATDNPALGVSTGTYHQWGVRNEQNNKVIGLHGRVNLAGGLSVTGNSSYTWSEVKTPLGYYNTANNYRVTDFTPSDVRITRVGLTAEYTPAKYQHITARAGYSNQKLVDKTDSLNSGRAQMVSAGITAKF